MAYDEYPEPKYNVEVISMKEHGTSAIATSVLSGEAILSLSGGSLIFTGAGGTITKLAVT